MSQYTCLPAHSLWPLVGQSTIRKFSVEEMGKVSCWMVISILDIFLNQMWRNTINVQFFYFLVDFEHFIGGTQFSIPRPHLSSNQKFKQFLQVFNWNRPENPLSFIILSKAFRIRNMRAYTMSSKRKSSNWTRGGDPARFSSEPAWRRIHKLA